MRRRRRRRCAMRLVPLAHRSAREPLRSGRRIAGERNNTPSPEVLQCASSTSSASRRSAQSRWPPVAAPPFLGGCQASVGQKPVQARALPRCRTAAPHSARSSSRRRARTIYALTKGHEDQQHVRGACAQAAAGARPAAPGLLLPGSIGHCSAPSSSDGARQLVAGQWPLYTFSGDTKPGDVNGEGSGGVWFAVGTDGKLIRAPAAAGAAWDSPGRATACVVLSPGRRSPPRGRPISGRGYRLGSDRGSPNHGSTLFSKRVMAQIRSPVRVRT